ncbi:MAG: 30S ribosomal protein S16 [Sphaerobacteraceae bacterium]|nr:MAG: 30S ribosomal protein S16 [Sphaerobacteraceae bacterium]
MIKLRLRRMGAKKQPSYRIVAAESKNPRDGRFIEIVGHYDPKTDPYTLKINEERARHFLSNGAQPTRTVRALLVKSGILPGYQGPPAAATKQAAKEEAPADEAIEAEAEAETADDEATEEEAQS